MEKGKRLRKIFDPSSGQIGKRLKTAKNTFNWMKLESRKAGKLESNTVFKMRDVRIASIKLLAGPATDTKISSVLGFLKL